MKRCGPECRDSQETNAPRAYVWCVVLDRLVDIGAECAVEGGKA